MRMYLVSPSQLWRRGDGSFSEHILYLTSSYIGLYSPQIVTNLSKEQSTMYHISAQSGMQYVILQIPWRYTSCASKNDLSVTHLLQL